MHSRLCNGFRSGLPVLAQFGRIVSMAIMAVIGMVSAQIAPVAISKSPGVQVQIPQVPTLQSIHTASISQDITATRVRRFLAEDGSVVAVRELFETNGVLPIPSRDVAFLGVEGEPSGSTLWQKWAQTYQRFEVLLANSGVFCIRDLGRAQQNYTLHDFGAVVRAGRAARRLVVFPNVFDRAFWVVDVDSQTNALLYSAEFDSQLRLLSEVEVVSFQPSARLLPLQAGSFYVDFASASPNMVNQVGLINPDITLATSYAMDSVEIRDDALSGLQAMVASYSDGVDQILVVQMPGTSDWLAGLPGTSKGGQAMGRRYRDPTMSVHMFWEGGVTFHVAGGGAQVCLEPLAKRIYLQALNTP